MLARVGLYLSRHFQHKASGIFIKAQQKLLNNGLPSFSNTVHDYVTPQDFPLSLMFTKNKFSNKPHKDLDASTVGAGWWMQVDKINGSNNKNPTYKVSNGHFIFPENNFSVHFSQANGICQIILRAKDSIHYTESFIYTNTDTRLGLSVQVSKRSASFCTSHDIKSDNVHHIN
ncbi:hypothetical protein O181_034391 [Austropuccinia psidii MF-1]|uniref:Tet-like 2OG-Fe(II) oxygenase domain-containing protein n=1 Tax=Austropuccinia psidii MF-1 TaxID=1389203 RepID=A0A9Q3D696_9BASI|nr:hypothetical protein [Austropuccinia psidii MF-1]